MTESERELLAAIAEFCLAVHLSPGVPAAVSTAAWKASQIHDEIVDKMETTP